MALYIVISTIAFGAFMLGVKVGKDGDIWIHDDREKRS